MVSRIEPDRYADTGFSVKDTPPEINSALFSRMMSRPAGERMKMGAEMTASAKAFVRASLPKGLTATERRAAFLERFYGPSLDQRIKNLVARGASSSGD